MAAKQSADEKLREETAAAWRGHRPAEFHGEFAATTGAGEAKASSPEVHAADGYVVVNTHGEARFDRESFVVFRKALEKAFQVVA